MHLFGFLDGDKDCCFGEAQHSQKSREYGAVAEETRLRRRFGSAGSEVDCQRLDIFPCRVERLKDHDVACPLERDANEGDRCHVFSHDAFLNLQVPKWHLSSHALQRRAVLLKMLMAKLVVGA